MTSHERRKARRAEEREKYHADTQKKVREKQKFEQLKDSKRSK